ncbi:hypothetical protein BH11CYA1_BH11CYA1_16390 [soil metagenome]
MQKILAFAIVTVAILFLMGRQGGDSKTALINDSDVIGFANLLRMDLPAANACSVGGKASYHYATLILAAGSDIKGHMPKNFTVKYPYT